MYAITNGIIEWDIFCGMKSGLEVRPSRRLLYTQKFKRTLKDAVNEAMRDW